MQPARRFAGVSNVAALAVAACLALALAAPAGAQPTTPPGPTHTVSGTGAGQGRQVTPNCPPNAYCFNYRGAGSGSPMQSAVATGTGMFVPDIDPGLLPADKGLMTGQATGKVTLVDAENRRNKVFADLAGDATLTPVNVQQSLAPTAIGIPLASIRVSGTYLVTGGEGDYAGARGNGPANGTGILRQLPDGSYVVDGELLQLQGEIVTPNWISAIPTVSAWALLLLGALLVTFAIRQRQRQVQPG